MKSLVKYLFILTGIVLSQWVFAESVVVIVNSANQQDLSASDIKAIYTDKLIQWNDHSTIKSFDLPVEDAVREQFSQKILGVSARDTAREWANRKITNSAKNPAYTKREKMVLLSVKRYRNAIGYVSKSAASGTNGVRVVMTID